MQTKIQHKLLSYFKQHQLLTIKTSCLLISPNVIPKGVYLLTKGEVRCYAISKDGDDITINTYKPFSFFPMRWATKGTPERYFYESTKGCELYLSPKRNFLDFITQNPDVLLDLLDRIYTGLEGYMLRMESLLSGNAYVRLLLHLMIHIKRSREYKENQINFPMNIRQKLLASETGLSRETVARQLKILKQKNIFSSSKSSIKSINISAFEAELSKYL